MNYKDLDVWKSSMLLAEEVYKTTREYPVHEQYSITSQIRRSAVSVPSNIAEGATRNSDNEFIRFLYIAQGSLAELETQLILSQKLNYITPEQLQTLINQKDQTAKMIYGLINYNKRKITTKKPTTNHQPPTTNH